MRHISRYGSFSLVMSVLLLLSSCAPGLQWAAWKGDTDKVRTLLDQGVNVNETFEGMTALMVAADYGHAQTARVLLAKGAYPDFKGKNGMTAMHLAVHSGHIDVVRVLLEAGADPEPGSASFGSGSSGTPLMIAQQKGFTSIAVLLRDAVDKKMTAGKGATAGDRQQASSPSFRTSDIDILPPAKAVRKVSGHAVVIGIEQYRQNLPRADYAVSDAKTMTQYLTKVLGYPEENTVTLLNDHATNVDLVKYFEKWLPNNVEPGSSVFIYYSGHGAPDPRTGSAYLVPYDGDPSFIAETGYSLKRMYEALGRLPAKEIIVALDSCFSGAGGRSVIAKGSRPLVMNLQSNLVLPKNVTVLSASSGDQTSSTYDEKGHGLFTYFMLKGIKNEDVVRQDGSLAINDLYGYLKPQVERIARKQYNNEQTPQLIEPKKN